MAFTVKGIPAWGRTFAEYRRMFALTEHDLSGHILGCADGPSSFNAEAAQRRHAVISVDPVYTEPAAVLEARFEQSRAAIVQQLAENMDSFVWSEFATPAALVAHRRQALDLFLADYPAGRAGGRYVAGALPALPFRDRQFTLALVSHFLFLFSALLDEQFHRAALAELCRVAAEVRIFPLEDFSRQRSPGVAALITHARERGWRAAVVPVPYEFQRGSNAMLRIEKKE